MIHKIIEQGESKTTEFKIQFPKNSQIAQTACAFANRAGGHMLIGIADNGTIVGLDENQLNEYMEKIPNILHDSIFPMLIPEIYTYNLEGRRLLVIQIYPGSNTPYYIKDMGKLKGTYVRIGRTNKLADEEMIKELERQKINKSFDEDIYDECNKTDAEKLIYLLSDVFKQEVSHEKLLNLGLVERISDKEFLTNAGAIILGNISNTSVKCAKFLGESIVDFIDKKEYSGNIFDLLNNTVMFLKNHLHLSGLIKGKGLRREDVLEIPEEVLREGIINALIHRDYSITGADIKVAVFESRVEITSPGGLPKSLTVEDIYAGRSEIRNRVISKIFAKSGYVEQWGSGIPRMREICKLNGIKKPEIEEKGLFVTLRIYRKDVNVNSVSNNASSVTKTKNEVIQIDKDKIRVLLIDNPGITVKDIAGKLSITVASVQRRLKSMQEDGQIIRIGSKKSGYWEVKD